MRARAALSGKTFVVVFDGATSQSRAYRAAARKAFRQELSRVGPTYESYEVRIWIEGYRRGRRLDADNVAKAVLDSLVGLVWRDDRQVTRLIVEKLSEGGERIVLAASPTDIAETSEAMATVLADAGLAGGRPGVS